MSIKSMYYLSIHATPKPQAGNELGLGGAYVHCWVDFKIEAGAELLARAYIQEQGWTPCETQEVWMWFDRAVAAEFDYIDAYSSMTWSLRPRWGGSHEAMYAFGKECLDTARFDTCVAMWYWKTLRDIGGKGEHENQVLWLKRRGVHDDMEKLIAHILASKQPKQNLHYWASVRVIVAYVAGKRDKAAEYYRALGKDFMMQAFAAYPSLDARRYKERFDKLLTRKE